MRTLAVSAQVRQGGAVKGGWLLVIVMVSCQSPRAGTGTGAGSGSGSGVGEAPTAVPAPVPAPVPATAPAAATPVEDWAQLPDEWTRTAPKNVLKRGDRLIAGNRDGLFELTWWGKPKKRLSEHAVRAVRWWDERTLVYVDDAFALRKYDLAMTAERRVAQLPRQFVCKDQAPLQWHELTLVLDREADVVCVRSQVDNARVMVAAGLASRALRMRVKCPDGRTRGPKIACEETGRREETPAIDAPDEPTEAHLPLPETDFPFRINVLSDLRLAVMRRGRDGVEHRVALLKAAPGPISPSGRWQPLNQQGGWSLLDRTNGRLTLTQPGAWPAPLGSNSPRNLLIPAKGEPAWLPHSDVLLLGNLVIVPGVGGYNPGLVAR